MSSSTPAGAAANPAIVGVAEWQAAQRRATTTRTSVNATPALAPAGGAGRRWGWLTKASSTMPSVAAGRIQTARRPWLRRLNQCRVRTPSTESPRRISQLSRLPYVVG